MTKFSLIFMFFMISSFGFSQYPIVIDSLVFQYIGKNQLLVIDNGIGERHEHMFNEMGEQLASNYSCLYDDNNDSIYLLTDSIKTINGEKLMSSYEINLLANNQIKKITSQQNCMCRNYRVFGDTVTWIDSCSKLVIDYQMIYRNNAISTFTSKIKFDSGRQLLDAWNIHYANGKIYLFSVPFMNAYVIEFNKNLPVKMKVYDFLNLYRNIQDPEQAFMDHEKKKKASYSYTIFYGKMEDMPVNSVTNEKTIKKFKLRNGLE